jgi:glycosyltransferase involved in cell wall biosynthesis
MKPKVCVCETTYSQERYIKDCLISVIAQEHDVELEILVGDDASTDCTSVIIKEIAGIFHGVIKLFRHEEYLGPAANTNFLLKKLREIISPILMETTIGCPVNFD